MTDTRRQFDAWIDAMPKALRAECELSQLLDLPSAAPITMQQLALVTVLLLQTMRKQQVSLEARIDDVADAHIGKALHAFVEGMRRELMS